MKDRTVIVAARPIRYGRMTYSERDSRLKQPFTVQLVDEAGIVTGTYNVSRLSLITVSQKWLFDGEQPETTDKITLG